MIFYVLFLGQAIGLNGVQMIWFSIYIMVLFLCVILHEYGHALTAKKYGVETLDIIISPIGGLARLKSLPDKPIQEFYIAIAGPLVNVIIALVLGLVIYLGFSQHPLAISDNFDKIHIFSEFLKMVFLTNVALFVFNLIPAFPMDGGRILRALLSLKLTKVKATQVASILGKVLAVGFMILAFMNQHLILGFISIFIFSMAHAEYKQTKIVAKLKSTKIGTLAIEQYDPLYASSLIKDITASQFLKSRIVVNESGYPIGSLPIHFIEDAKENLNEELKVWELASPKIRYIDESVSVEKAKLLMQEEGLSIIAVTKNGQLHGVVDRDIILNFIKSY